MIDAYPLTWPHGWPRTPPQNVTRSQFKGTQDKVQRELIWEIERLRAGGIVISTNVELRRDGYPYAGRKEPSDCGVAVYFYRNKTPMCFACDKYQRIWENMRAIQKTIEALRGIERWGASDMMERAFTGFVALPPPGQSTARGWREVLGVSATENNLDTIKLAYRSLAAKHHPDRGGSMEAMQELNWAWAQA